METAGPRAAAREPRKSAGRAPLQDLSLQQLATPQKQKFSQSAMESAKPSSLTPLFCRLRLQDGRSPLPGSQMSPAIKILGRLPAKHNIQPQNCGGKQS
ncbi:unnamed protein product [Lepidochelys kempii]